MISESQDTDSEWDFVQALDLLLSPSGGRSYLESHKSLQRPISAPPNERWTGDRVSGSTMTERHLSHDSYEDGSVFKLLHSDLGNWASTSEKIEGVGLSVASKHPPDVLNHPQSSKDGLSSRAPRTGPPQACLKSTSVTVPPIAQVTKATVMGISTPPPSSNITILRRPSKNTNDQIPVNPHPHIIVNSLPQSLVHTTTCTNNSKVMPRAKPKPNKKNKQAPKNNVSESSAEAESDLSPVLFDRPLPKKSGVMFVPSQVGSHDVRSSNEDTPPSSFDDVVEYMNSDKVKAINFFTGPMRLYPKYVDESERRVSLMTKLLTTFDDYAQLVSQLGRPQVFSNALESRPVHVFVDTSNILVGFHDAVKIARNIPVTSRIRRIDISFINLSLILQRGRTTAKTVLVGSDRVPSIDEAEKLGYEANILDRVHKMKHTPSRPSKYRKPPGKGSQCGKPEMAVTSAERWVEQGVDEILHLKILESLVDTDEPATIVLATGDAAEAEYSAGFMRMVERALQRGWNVELVNFSHNASYAYKKKEFRERWGYRFSIVELDQYVEELFV
ncbi:hypothetical protein N7486_008995 [Penicillium sp. IBT 16267x]|nr:hypothetical protein N7486_008995 [Penicillium sp. IBT 16267x]